MISDYKFGSFIKKHLSFKKKFLKLVLCSKMLVSPPNPYVETLIPNVMWEVTVYTYQIFFIHLSIQGHRLIPYLG
jgi:hypothetical protein